MVWSWAGVLALVLALAGCDGDEESPGNVMREDGAQAKTATVGSPPTIPPAPVEGVEARPPRPTVVAAGQTARGDAFELVLYGTGRGLCISTLLPERDSDAGGACGEHLLPRLSSPIMATGSATFGRNEHELSGFVSRDVERVQLTFELDGETESIDAVTEQLPRRLLSRAGAHRPLGVFVGFLPEGVTAGDVAATAYAADGDSLGTTEWFVPDQGLTGLKSAATGRGGPNENRKVAIERCSTQSQARFPGAFTARRNLVVGPLAMIGAGRGRVYFFPDFASDAGGQKFQLLVRNGHRVTLELSRRTRRDAGLAYGPLPGGEGSLADAHRVVKFIACRRGAPSGSTADGRSVTFWSGGVLVRSPQCVPLRVFVDGARAPRRAVIHLGVRRCR